MVAITSAAGSHHIVRPPYQVVRTSPPGSAEISGPTAPRSRRRVAATWGGSAKRNLHVSLLDLVTSSMITDRSGSFALVAIKVVVANYPTDMMC